MHYEIFDYQSSANRVASDLSARFPEHTFSTRFATAGNIFNWSEENRGRALLNSFLEAFGHRSFMVLVTEPNLAMILDRDVTIQFDRTRVRLAIPPINDSHIWLHVDEELKARIERTKRRDAILRQGTALCPKFVLYQQDIEQIPVHEKVFAAYAHQANDRAQLLDYAYLIGG